MFRFIVYFIYYNILKAIYRFKHIERKIKNQFKIANSKTPLDPTTIPKYVNQLVKPPVYKPFYIKNDNKCDKSSRHKHLYFVDISEFKQQVLPNGYPTTTVWGYGGLIKDPKTHNITYSRSAPGATFEAIRNIPVSVKWINNLTGPNLFAVDPTLHWANPNNVPMNPDKPWPTFPPGFPKAQKPVPTVTHLHGGEVPSIYDGHPDAWFTYDGKKGPAYVTDLYTYPNKQEPTTLWYHDHSLGITRLNVYAGLAGFYLLRDFNKYKKTDRRVKCNENRQDERTKNKFVLPYGKYEIPIVIQDRSFYTDGSFAFYNKGINPDIHPYWVPEFLGDTIMVNGKVWPNLEVERRQYRFRLLNGSNARFYNLRMSNGMKFIQIGSDGGFLPKPVELESLLIAPGERADILVDFSGIEPDTTIIMTNDANSPYPGGEAPDRETVGQIMQFTVPINSPEPVIPKPLPGKINRIPKLISDSPQRTLTLNEVIGENGPLELLLDGQRWSAPISEFPKVGSTEDWVIANLTMDTHPIHLHLIQFQVVNRQDFNADEYKVKWDEMNHPLPLDQPTKVLPVEPYLIGDPISPDDNEKGWKDTVRMNPHQVTRIRVRFAPQNIPVCDSESGLNWFSFNPTLGPGYVWHCHILDHEDNEMMRPYKVRS